MQHELLRTSGLAVYSAQNKKTKISPLVPDLKHSMPPYLEIYHRVQLFSHKIKGREEMFVEQGTQKGRSV